MNLAWSLFLLLFLGGGAVLTGLGLALLKDRRKEESDERNDKAT